MTVIATLGPQETFSDLASREVRKQIAHCTISYYDSIPQIFKAVENGDAELAVVPIENVLAGFVQPVLDALVKGDLTVQSELILPVLFSCVGHCETVDDIKKIYVQPVAKGQCQDFLNQLKNSELVMTSSNVDSYHKFMKSDDCTAAIVPKHLVETMSETPVLLIEDVTDYSHNQTRFIVLSKGDVRASIIGEQKTSLIIRDDSDHSGILRDIAQALAKRDINMLSIISRPTREAMGKYYFFIDLEGSVEQAEMREAIQEIEEEYYVKVLGSYQKATF